MKEINFAQAAALTSPNPLVLVCTKKENGLLNMAPVSFAMFASVSPFMLAFAMAKPSNTGANIRRTGKAVLVTPGLSLKDAAMAYGSITGSQGDKLAQIPVPLQSLEGIDIQIPEDSRAAFLVSLVQTVDAGDHYLYLCNIDKALGDETKEALLAWEGYTKLSPAGEK